MSSGIYKIINNITSDFYIGSAASFYFRKSSHWSYLKNNKHFNAHLQRSVNKHGLENFDFIIIEECEKDKLIEREQYYLDALKPAYNIRSIANSNIGIKFSEEVKQNMSNAQKEWRKGKDLSIKLTKELCNEVLELKSKGLKNQEIALKLNISLPSVSKIIKPISNKLRKLNEIRVKEIKKLISLNYSFKSIGNKYGVSESVISNINAGRMWKNIEFDNTVIVNVENLEQSTFLSSKDIEDIKIKMLNLTGKHGELKELSKELNIPYSKLIDIKRNKTWVDYGM